jgi:hypothetical protein
MHESEQKFSVRKCKTMKLNESYQLVTTLLVLNTYSRKIHNIFWATRTAAVTFQLRWTSLLSISLLPMFHVTYCCLNLSVTYVVHEICSSLFGVWKAKHSFIRFLYEELYNLSLIHYISHESLSLIFSLQRSFIFHTLGLDWVSMMMLIF